jgi:hypothetical protein
MGWRQGEYQALLRLPDIAKGKVAPIITVPPVEFDFEEWRPKKTVDEHIKPFAKRFREKWKDRFAWVGVHPELEKDGDGQGIAVMQRVLSDLRSAKSNTVPEVSLASADSIYKAAESAVNLDERGAALRTTLADIMKPDFSARALDSLKRLGLDSYEQVDILVDLLCPAYEPYEVFAGALSARLNELPIVAACRNYVLFGSAMPSSMGDIEVPGDDLVRHDWLFYQAFRAGLSKGHRLPLYGDYTIVAPGFVALDMRKIKPAGKVVYTDGPKWMVRKGGAFRSNPTQMHDHCAHIARSSGFRGAEFSDGDDYIARCAVKEASPSNLSRWKQVGINHHIVHVLDDLAKSGARA